MIIHLPRLTMSGILLCLPALFFQVPSDKIPESQTDTKTKEQEADEDRQIICRQCANIITNTNNRITIDGAHEHTFANPHGIVLEIGCFSHAIGCAHVGQPTDEFSWFPGFHWKVAVCHRCIAHLGWRFSSTSGQMFHGLILDRLADSP